MKNTTLLFTIIFFVSCSSSIKNERTEIQVIAEKPEVKKTIQEEIQHPIQEQVQEDESFMDFFSDFMWNENFQLKHIDFPLIVDDDTLKSGNNWTYIPFYTTKSYMPILYQDTVSLWDLKKSSNEITLSIVSFDKKKVRNYLFDSESRIWMLKTIRNESLELHSDYGFIDFLIEFSNDSIFQTKHIGFPLPNYYLDSSRDYEYAYDSLTSNDWIHLNIIDSMDGLMSLSINGIENLRNVYFRGVENGIQVHYLFKKVDEEWKLIKVEDYST